MPALREPSYVTSTMPLHFDAIRQGRMGYNDPFMRWVIERLNLSPTLKARLIQVLTRELSPTEMIPTSTMLSIMASALVRGRFDVVPGFLRMGKQLGAEARELARHQTLLDAARAKLAHAA